MPTSPRPTSRVDTNTRVDPDKQKKFLDTWNEHIGEAPAEFRKEFLGGLKATMNIKYDPDGRNQDKIKMYGYLRDEHGSTLGKYERDIDFGNNAAESVYFALNAGVQGSGIGKRLLAANVALYQKLGLDEVKTHANIDVGGYAWARYGYVPNRYSWDEAGEPKSKPRSTNCLVPKYSASKLGRVERTPAGPRSASLADHTRDEFYESEVELARQWAGARGRQDRFGGEFRSEQRLGDERR